MNSTPPRARSIVLVVLTADCPSYSATKSLRDVSTSLGSAITPSPARMLATTRAIVVFPVPGGPVKIMCLLGCATFMPRAARTLRHLRCRAVPFDLVLDAGEPDLPVQFGLAPRRAASRGRRCRPPHWPASHGSVRAAICSARGGRQTVGRILQRGSDFRLRMGGLQPFQERHARLLRCPGCGASSPGTRRSRARMPRRPATSSPR